MPASGRNGPALAVFVPVKVRLSSQVQAGRGEEPLSFLLGVFNLWSVAGLLAVGAALWLLRTEDTDRNLD